MGMTSVSVVMTVVVLNFHHRGPIQQEVPDWIRSLVLDKLRRFLRIEFPQLQSRLQKPVSTPSDSPLISLKKNIETLQAELLGQEIENSWPSMTTIGNSMLNGGPPQQYGNFQVQARLIII